MMKSIKTPLNLRLSMVLGRSLGYMRKNLAPLVFGVALMPLAHAQVPFSPLYTTSGLGMTYSVIGKSELNDSSSSTSGCARTKPQSFTAALPADTKLKKAFVFWGGATGIEFKSGFTWYRSPSPYPPYTGSMPANSQLLPFAANQTLNTPQGTITVTSAQELRTPIFSFYNDYFANNYAEITNQLGGEGATAAQLNGVYSMGSGTSGIVGGAASNWCPYKTANARSWYIIFVYESLSSTLIGGTGPNSFRNEVQVYNGMQSEGTATGISWTISGLQPTTGIQPVKASVVVTQGDRYIPGESLTTSDAAFGNWPSGFADGSGTGATVGAEPAFDVDTKTGVLTAGATSISFNMFSPATGSGQEFINAQNFIFQTTLPTVYLNKGLAPLGTVPDATNVDTLVPVNNQTISDGETAYYIWTLDNSTAYSQPASGTAFSDTLPTGLQLASPVVAGTTCPGSAVNANTGNNTVTLSSFTMPAQAKCYTWAAVTNKPSNFNYSCASNPGAFTNAASNHVVSDAITNAVAPSPPSWLVISA